MESRFVTKARTIFVAFILFFSTAPIIPLLRRANAEVKRATDPGLSDPLMQLIWLFIYCIVLLLILLDWKKICFVLAKDKILTLLVVLATMSVLWSTAPRVTLVRSVAMIFTTLIGIYIATFYSFKDQLKLLGWVLGIVTILSLIFITAFPRYGIEHLGHNAGDWRGIYHQKNVLGRYMSLATIVLLFVSLSSYKYRKIIQGIFLSTIVLLVFSDSKNALVTTIVVVFFIPFFKFLRTHYLLKTVLIVGAILLSGSMAILLITNYDTLLTLMGKDPTLSGRTDLWSLLFEYIRKKPFLGYGYNGFWGGNAAEVWENLTWRPRHAHNGFIQIALDLGLGGLFLFSVHFAKSILSAVTQIHQTKQIIGLWPLTFLLFNFFSNLAEFTILDRNNILWVLYISTTVSMALERQKFKFEKVISVDPANLRRAGS